MILGVTYTEPLRALINERKSLEAFSRSGIYINSVLNERIVVVLTFNVRVCEALGENVGYTQYCADEIISLSKTYRLNFR